MASAGVPAPKPSDDYWSVYRATITQLYMEENKTLSRVMAIMEADYGFVATCTRPGSVSGSFRRNHSADRALDMLQGRDGSRWNFGDKEVSTTKLRQYIKRTKSLGDRNEELLVQLGALERCPGSLEYHPPTSLAAPDLLRNTEQGLVTARDYIQCSLLSGCWGAASPTDICMSKAVGHAGRTSLSQFHDMASKAINLISSSSLAQCTALPRVCLNGLQDVLRDEDPFLVTDMIDIIYHLHVRGLSVLKMHCLRHFQNLSAAVLSRVHPISRLWKALAASAADGDQGSQLLIHVFQAALDQFASTLGPEHVTTLFLNSTKFNFGLPDQTYAAEEEWVRSHLERLEELNILDGRWAWLQQALARILFFQGNLPEAWTIVNRLLSDPRLAELVNGDPFRKHDFAMLLAYMMRGENNREAAKSFLRDAVSIAEQHQGKFGPSVLDSLTHLEICLREWGDLDEADSVRKQRLGLIQGYILSNGLTIGV